MYQAKKTMINRYKTCFHIIICIALLLVLIRTYRRLKTTEYKPRATTSILQTVYTQDANHTIPKPHIVLGILSAATKHELRDAQRKTWLWTAMRTNLPFKLTYKFLLDMPTQNSIAENAVHNDIVYLNVTHHGYAVKYGEKIYTWFKYIVNTYPDAYMGARIDDDVFLCVPQIFQRLDEIKSPRLYYGWAHNPINKTGKRRRVDEMFVVVGRDLMDRISKRKYCENKRLCNITEQLVEFGFGTDSLAAWLSVYDDVNIITDNDRIMHFGKMRIQKHAPYVKQGFCEEWLLFHKSNTSQMQQLHDFNMAYYQKGFGHSENGSASAVSGSLFLGTVVRDLPPRTAYSKTVQTIAQHHTIRCDYWAVVTTIFRPSKAVRTIASDPRWCLVVIADSKTPVEDEYMKGITSDKVVYLSVDEQRRLYPLLADCLSLNSFGRKNIGYMFAINHGAKAIWDFDDDNVGVIDIKEFLNASVNVVTICDGFKYNIANPYPYFTASFDRVWPRGFPLQYIRYPETIPRLCKQTGNVNLGVVQSLANVEPDVDAIYRMTYDTPFNFTATEVTHSALVLPIMVYAPFNAQATLWLPPAFEYLALPVSVHGRVSDIWRSYIAQYFMHKDGSHIVFSTPYVTQLRNEHELIRDFNAELDLYQKSKQLVDFLSTESGKIENMMSMYEMLYQRGYLEIDDLRFINAWTQTVQVASKRP